MADLDDLKPSDLPGFSDDSTAGQTSGDPDSVAEADLDAPSSLTVNDPGTPGARPVYADDDGATSL